MAAMRIPGAGMLLAFAMVAASASAATTSTVVDIPVAGGDTQRFLWVRPDSPVATLIAIPGGDGVLGIQNDGTSQTTTFRCGPVGRNRIAFADRGFAVVYIDATSSGRVRNLDDVRAVIDHVRARDSVPVWLTGGSAATGTAANLAVSLPGTDPVGLVLFSPAQLPASFVAQVRRPSLVVFHPGDPTQFGNQVFSALTSAPVREIVALDGGSNAGCGFHLFAGLDAQFVDAVAGFVARNNTFATSALNYQGLWYASPAESEPGWGVNLAHQGNTLFATWFTYDADGPMWLVMSNGVKISERIYRGTLFRTTGPRFDSVPFLPSGVGVSEVGSATFEFEDANNGVFSYNMVSGINGSKRITRQIFSSPVPQCSAGTAPSTTNFQDLWWASPPESESGWGLNVTHQGEILFATWFTYGASGKGRWLVMPAMNRVGTTGFRYTGSVLETRGAPFNAYNPAQFGFTTVGTATLDFTAASAGTFTYTVDGVTQAKAITRQVFSSPITTCR